VTLQGHGGKGLGLDLNLFNTFRTQVAPKKWQSRESAGIGVRFQLFCRDIQIAKPHQANDLAKVPVAQ
jgi:hypothetical protein